MTRLLEFIINFIIDRVILWPFYIPIVFSLKKVKTKGFHKKNGITILAINVDRFRDGELESLVRSGFTVLLMPYNWQTRIFYAYKERGLKNQFKNPSKKSSIYKDRVRIRSYLSYLLKSIYLKKNIDCVIGAGIFYNQDLDWGAVSVNIGYPYLVFHRENLVITEHLYLATIKKAKSLNKTGFFGTSIIFHNKIMKDIYDKYSGVDKDKIHALGSLRMDSYLENVQSSKIQFNKNTIVLFSFPPSVALRQNMETESGFGWYQLHNEVHTSFVELAVENPSIDFIIKHKGVGWAETETLLRDLNALKLTNLKIYGELHNAQELILQSSAVTGFCSTALLEASIAGKPVIVPLLGEAKDEKYRDCLCFSEELAMFNVATSKHEYKELLIKRPAVSQEKMKLRRLSFEKYISPLDSTASEKYSQLIVSEVEKSKLINTI